MKRPQEFVEEIAAEIQLAAGRVLDEPRFVSLRSSLPSKSLPLLKSAQAVLTRIVVAPARRSQFRWNLETGEQMEFKPLAYSASRVVPEFMQISTRFSGVCSLPAEYTA